MRHVRRIRFCCEKLSFRQSSALILSLLLSSILCLRTFLAPATHASFTDTQTTAKTKSTATIESSSADCSQLFLYLPHDISNNGICSQLQNYILALHVAATFQRTLIVWEPQLLEQNNLQTPLVSNFGCAHDANFASKNHGLSQILDIPSSRNHACSHALCSNQHFEWTRLVASSSNDFAMVTCDTASVMVSGGRKLRRQYIQRLHQTPQQTNFTQWVSWIGSNITSTQIEWFHQQQQQVQKENEEDPWIGVAALLVPHVQWQPLLQPKIAEQLQTLQLPHPFTSLHIRRGDKLKREATTMVQQYWASRGEESNSHPNYIPLEAYVAQLQPIKDPSHVYIATDDPVTIRNEIEQYEATHGSRSYWTFHLLADHRLHYGHMNTEPDCHVRYNMTVDAIVDLEVMIRAQVFVGELNSNWGRFIHTMRTEFTGPSPTVRDFRVVFGENHTRYLGQ